MTDSLPSPLEGAKKLLISAAVGSCTCNTKSPELIWHTPDCRYPLIMMALENVEIAQSRPSEPLQCLRCGTVDAFGSVSQEKASKPRGCDPCGWPECGCQRAPVALHLADRLEVAYGKVKEWPEKSPTGFMDLLELRNLVPQTIEALRKISSAITLPVPPTA